VTSKYLSKKSSEYINQMNSKTVKVGGFGKKIFVLIYENANCMICLNTKTNKWDSCAG
jgi:hypothetical protein